MDNPEEEVTTLLAYLKFNKFCVYTPYHALRSDALAGRNMILDISVRRPNCLNHDRHTLGTIGALDAQPEHSKN